MDNDNGYKVIGFWILSFATIWLNKQKAKKKQNKTKTTKQKWNEYQRHKVLLQPSDFG